MKRNKRILIALLGNHIGHFNYQFAGTSCLRRHSNQIDAQLADGMHEWPGKFNLR